MAGAPVYNPDGTVMVVCCHHMHDGPPEPAVWKATDRHGIELGEFCTEHLGDGLDDFDADVRLERIEP
jgi:hypothetical protein